MAKVDIRREVLYISRLTAVVQAHNSSRQGRVTVNGRHSDAFIYILSGSCTYTFKEGYTLTAQAGDVLYLASRAVYDMEIHTERYEFIFCDFEFAGDAPRRSDVFTPKNALEQRHTFQKLKKQFADGTMAACLSLLYGIYAAVCDTAAPYLGNTARRIAAEAAAYMERECHSPQLTVAALAQRAGVSEVYFRKVFSAAYGTAPSKYLTLLRLEKAKGLLRYPFLSLEECALQSGFSSLPYFCRVFKSHTGETPARYRKHGQ